MQKKVKRANKKLKNLSVKGKAKQVRGGAFDTYANFGDIKGESLDDKYKQWIEVESFSPGVTRPSIAKK